MSKRHLTILQINDLHGYLEPHPGVPKKYGSNRQKIEIDAIESLQQLFAPGRQVSGSRRGSVVAI